MDRYEKRRIEKQNAVDNAAAVLSDLWIREGADAFLKAFIAAIMTVQHPKGKDEAVQRVKIVAGLIVPTAERMSIG